jgi:uncharacterized protein (TIGR03083 family)
MLDTPTLRSAVRHELDAFADRARALGTDDWSRSVPCEGWTVADLVPHTATSARCEGEALAVMLAGGDTVPADTVPPWTSVADALDQVAAGQRLVHDALDRLAPAHDGCIVPLPFSRLPTPLALAVMLIEYGFHRHDLAVALGEAGSEDVDAETAATLIELVGPLVSTLTSKPPAEPVAVVLAAPTATTAIGWRTDAWALGDVEGLPTLTVSGSDSAVALFAMGRIGAGDPALVFTGATAHAGSFKAWFPGP